MGNDNHGGVCRVEEDSKRRLVVVVAALQLTARTVSSHVVNCKQGLAKSQKPAMNCRAHCHIEFD